MSDVFTYAHNWLPEVMGFTKCESCGEWVAHAYVRVVGDRRMSSPRRRRTIDGAGGNRLCKANPVCPTGAITYVEDEQEPLGGRIEFDLSKCDGCGKCADACCGKAIEMKWAL